MDKEPVTARRLARRLALWGTSTDPQKGAELRYAYRQHIEALENGKGSYTDKERRAELAQAKNDYGRLVDMAPIEDQRMPMGSTDVGNIIQKANPVVNSFAKGSTPGIGEKPSANRSSYNEWLNSLPANLRHTNTSQYNMRGAYDGGLIPEMNQDGSYHLGSRNPKTGEILKTPNHPTWDKMVKGEADAGYEIYKLKGKYYSQPKGTPMPTGATAYGTQTTTGTNRDSIRSARQSAVAGAGGSSAGVPAGLLPTGETNPFPTAGVANFDTLKPKVTSGLSPTITPSKPLSVPTTSVDTTASGGGGGLGLNADTLSMAGNAASLLFGVLGASKPLPKYAMPPEWEMLGSRLKTMSQQGLSPESQALAKNQLASNFNTTLAQTRGMTGGGGSSSEAAANSIDASSRFGPQYLQMAVANQDAQRANMAPYMDYLRTNLSIDQQAFSRDYNQAANNQNNYATLASQSLQQLQQAPYEHQNDGLWQEYMDGMLQDRARTRLAIQKKTELATSFK